MKIELEGNEATWFIDWMKGLDNLQKSLEKIEEAIKKLNEEEPKKIVKSEECCE